MKRFWDRLAPRIWTRLFLLVVAAILLTWLVLGVAFHWLGQARLVVSDLSGVQAPRLARTARLSTKAADLAMLSNRILFAGGENPDALESQLKETVAELSALMEGGVDAALTRRDAESLQRQLGLVIRTLDHAQRIEKRLLNRVDQLRWLNVDIQDETTAVMADFAYNIEVLTRGLAKEADPVARKQTADKLKDELILQSTFADISNDTATAMTLAVQIATSQSIEQLEQFEDLVSDALVRINANIGALPAKPDYLFLRQASQALGRVTAQPDGVVQDRKAWHAARARLGDLLKTVFVQLSEMQGKLQAQTARQRADLAALSQGFSDSAGFTFRLLLSMTILAAISGLAILFYYIRPSIIQPMQNLTTAMRRIAAGEVPSLPPTPARNDEIGQLAAAVTAFQDSVRERDQAIRDLHQTQSELVQAGKMAALGNLSAGISHELNQPLGAIRQRLRLAEKAADRGDQAKLKAQVEKIDDLVSRMERIISHLRRFARRSEYQREDVALAPTIRAAADLLQAPIMENRVALRIDPELETATVIGDAVLVEQVLVNLLSNACDAIAATGRPGEISIRREQPGAEGRLAFSVCDNGIGLGELDPQRAFDPFVTTKDPGQGLGLGLSISFNIVTGMNGALTLARRADVGTRATVTLPEGAPRHDR